MYLVFGCDARSAHSGALGRALRSKKPLVSTIEVVLYILFTRGNVKVYAETEFAPTISCHHQAETGAFTGRHSRPTRAC